MDNGEEIIFLIKEMISKLNRIIDKKNEEEFENPSLAGNESERIY